MRDSGIVRAHAFGSFCFDTNSRRFDAEKLGYMPLNGFGVRADLWRGENQSAVHVPDDITGVLNLLQCLAHEHRRVSALPFRITRGKVRPNVSRGDCAEQRVGQGMQ